MNNQTEMSASQTRLLRYLREHISEHGFAPSIDEMTAACEWKSKSSASTFLDQLCDEGFINRFPGKSRAITITRKGKAAKLPAL